jgi:ParB-like nuclease domain
MGAEENTAHGRPREDDEDDVEIPVHPFAAAFPMIDEEGLNELAASIKENGLRHPILLSSGGQLIDGRNRLEACRRAGVEPRFETIDEDPIPLILDENVRHRHLNKSQQAMAVAMAYPEPTRSKRHSSESEELENVHSGTLSMARLVFAQTPEIAQMVLGGERALDLAYKDAVAIRERKKTSRARLDTLKADFPDLAAKVVDETLSLEEAEAAAAVRRKEAEQREEAARASSKQCALNHQRAFGLLGYPHADLKGDAEGAVEEMQAFNNVPAEFAETCLMMSDYLRAMAAKLGRKR